ncbi:MAG: hypothetical protein V5A84_00395 [Planctomycetota bacterium]
MASGEKEADAIYNQFMGCFRDALDGRSHQDRRIGAELKFPLVNRDDGTAVEHEMVDKLWQYLADRGWSTVDDDASGKVVGATHPGEHNETVASCETGYCKTEFSLAHVGNLFDLEESLEWLREELTPFARENEVYFLGYGIQPVTPPGEDLLMQDGRSSVWDSVFGSNRYIPEDRGVDFHLFTINSDNHVHVSVDEEEEAIRTVNVLNGFSGAQIAISAHSNIWRGRIDPDYKCITEKFWDWWMEDANRVGVPEKPFEDPRDYVDTIAKMKPVYVKRNGKPVVLEGHESFRDYYTSERTRGQDAEGNEVELEPSEEDLDLHNSCYWYNARVSRYYTVENRTNDQQPPGEMVSVAALTLGLVNALGEAEEEIHSHDWSTLRSAREAACRDGTEGSVDGLELADLAGRMVDIARKGLERRGKGEEKFLEPLEQRVRDRRCPADGAADLFNEGGIQGLLEGRTFTE